MGKEMGMWSEDMRLKIDGNLETEITQILSRPVPDQVELTHLKREKLRVKEEIERIRSETRH